MSLRPSSEPQEGEGALPLFNRIYAEHHRALYAYLLGRCGEADAAADLLQECAVRLWRHIEDVRSVPEERRRYWLFAMARNVANDYHRRRGYRARHEEPLPERDLPAAVGAHSSAPAHDTDLDAALLRLPEEQRTLIALRFEAGMTSEEIGQALGRPAGTIRYQIAKARVRLAEELGLAQDAHGKEAVGA
jgi:RNA polymerase sigma-70 factor (ECF subfamily)